jgi:antitoxin StbD
MDTLLANLTVSVTELKRHYSDILKQADGGPVAVLNHNRPEAYLLTAAHYERLINYLEDLEDAQLVRDRGEGPFVDVTLADL